MAAFGQNTPATDSKQTSLWSLRLASKHSAWIRYIFHAPSSFTSKTSDTGTVQKSTDSVFSPHHLHLYLLSLLFSFYSIFQHPLPSLPTFSCSSLYFSLLFFLTCFIFFPFSISFSAFLLFSNLPFSISPSLIPLPPRLLFCFPSSSTYLLLLLLIHLLFLFPLHLLLPSYSPSFHP